MAKTWREWENPLIELEDGLAKLRVLARDATSPKKEELERMIGEFERRRDNYIEVMYSRLGPWEKVLTCCTSLQCNYHAFSQGPNLLYITSM